MWDYSIYLGNESESFHVDFISTEHLFITASIEDSIEKDEFKELFEQVRSHITEEKVNSLAGFEKAIDKGFKKLEKSDSFSLAASLSVDNVLYLVTRGGGKVCISRGSVFQTLIEGTQTSSGYMQDQDLVVLTNSLFTARTSESTLRRFIQDQDPQEIVESLAPDLKSADDTGLIALFARYRKGASEDQYVENTEVVEDAAVMPAQTAQVVAQEPMYALPQQNHMNTAAPTARFNIKNLWARMPVGNSLGKKATFALLIILVGVFIWSVILGNQRRVRNAFIKKVETEAQAIDSQLDEASSLTTSNVDRSLELLAAAKDSYATLKEEADAKKLSDLEQLKGIDSRIKEAEKSIKKEEETATEEFYDLNLIEKGASATSMYYDGTTLTMLDPDEAKVYMLSLEKKSVVTRKDNKVDGASFVAMHQEEPYVFSMSNGIFRITDDKVELLVEKDDEWGSIKDFAMYSGNIYILDTEKDEIYKYLVAEGGYSGKNSYIKSGKADLGKATALTIDGSVYITLGSKVLKYEFGNSVELDLKLPTSDDVDFDDIYTSRDVDNLYLLDKESKRIFVVSKEGEFLKQISASVIGNADDFVVDKEQGILLLAKDKIIKIAE